MCRVLIDEVLLRLFRSPVRMRSACLGLKEQGRSICRLPHAQCGERPADAAIDSRLCVRVRAGESLFKTGIISAHT